jgi:two-component system, LuxR family, sensor kinase FixL
MPLEAVAEIPPEAHTRDLQGMLLDAVDDGVGLLDAQGVLRLANPALAALLGRDPAELAGDPWRMRIADGEHTAWDTAFEAACRGERTSCATLLCGPDGHTVPVEITLRPLRGADDRVKAIALIACDPTRRQGNEEMLRWIARATAPLTGDDFFHTLTRHFAAAFGLRRAFIAECVDQPITRVRTLAYWYDAEMRPNFEFEIAGTPCERTIRDGRVYCLSDGLGELYPRARRLRLDGYLGAPIFDTSGRLLIGHVAFETEGPLDVAILASPLFQIFVSRASAELRRKRAEDVLRASEEHYRLLVEHQTDVVVKLDGLQRLLFVSPSYCRLFGADEQALLGSRFRPAVAEEDRGRFEAAWQSLERPPHEARFEERLATTQGWRCIAWSQKAMVDEENRITAVIAAGRDVTDRLRAEEQARQHLQQLAHVGRISAMGEMGSAIAHEINQPLTAVRTYAQACRRLLAAGVGPQELGDTLERVAHQAERAAEIIQRLRGFLAQQEVQAMQVDPNFLVREVIDLCRAEAGQCGVQLRLDLATHTLPRVHVDPIQVEQIVLNLVRNGIEAIQQGESMERVLTVSTQRRGREAWVSVQDSGPGVSRDAAARIFDAFFTTKPGGMGVGLALSRSIAEAHGGRLWLDETSGGALFHLALPAVADDEGDGA